MMIIVDNKDNEFELEANNGRRIWQLNFMDS